MPRGLSLYLVRHAIAAERGDAFPNDDLRPLTSGGSAKFRKAVKGLSRFDLALDVIMTSPLVRARQTADILAAGLGNPPRVVETDALRPGARFERLARAVGECGECSAIALVGHEPDIGAMAGRMIGGAVPLVFNKGAVCRIDFDEWPTEAPGRLRWFITQKILRWIGD